jgi:hypothetical protein
MASTQPSGDRSLRRVGRGRVSYGTPELCTIASTMPYVGASWPHLKLERYVRVKRGDLGRQTRSAELVE